jgi:acid phosphatase type 7
MLTLFLRGCIVVAFCLAASVRGQCAEPSPIQAAADDLLDRLVRQLRPFELRYLADWEVERLLTPSERRIFGNEHISFQVNVPVTLYVVRGAAPRRDPFWLRERSFTPSTIPWRIDKTDLKIWQRDFGSGRVGLGVNSFGGGGSQYVVVLAPKKPTDALVLSNIYPAILRTTNLHPGVKIYVDREDVFTNVPPQFVGYTLLQTSFDQRDDARVRDVFRWTDHPASDRPDQIVLTWNSDPQTSQTIQWRTSHRIKNGIVRYAKKSEIDAKTGRAIELEAKSQPLHTRLIVNDPVVRRHSVTLTNLEPGTTYRYAVGDGTPRNWSGTSEFTTAPASEVPFSFIYMGDAQNGLYRWGALLRQAYLSSADAAFYLVAGDIVDRGHERDDWDTFFYNTRGVFDRRTFIPVLGNHDCLGGHPTLYMKFFSLPKNGPPKVEKERAYSFRYSNALFVVLDSNLEPETQTAWLEQQLATNKATWKFVSFHHPAYSSDPDRDNKKIRELWAPIFEKHSVDFVLQGHDHAYLRTHPMKNGAPVDSAVRGTTYIVSVSGTKMYDQRQHNYTARGMTNVPTYQLFQIAGAHLTYRAHDIDGKLRDELVVDKAAGR